MMLMQPYPLSTTPETDRAPAHDDAPFSTMLILAGSTIFAAFAMFLSWAVFAPISSAVIAPGVLNVDTYRKKVQHLEGGIIEEIRVRDGDTVHHGQVLVILRDVAPASEVARLRAQYFEALAIAAQMEAERDGLDAIVFPEGMLTGAADTASASSAMAAMSSQQRVFSSRRELLQQSLSIMRQKILQSEEEVLGLRGQLAAVDAQLKYFEEEIQDAESLYTKKLFAKTRYLKLMRDNAELKGRRSEIRATIARTRQQILELDLKITEMQTTRIAGAVEQLRVQNTRAYELSRMLIAAEDVLRRTQIRSPVEGTVVDLQIHTQDGVIAAGQTVMEIVPISDRLVVDARVRPEDREEIRAGLKVNVVLTSLSGRDYHPIQGTLKSISADRLTDKATSGPFYLVRVHLDPASVEAQAITVFAGMGADVFIQTGQRTPLQYLTAPIVRLLNRGLREQ